ncbi:division/cell wall cluster transcriptional repressor MraZ [Allomuricauda sp. SCSIO 65647]|uniref:division/cell wall cluster transcriptional repressor MraZ n=1 Tax=Allomuricauda sp. SCSIO 65647 TaxID=2908843 RepID=UPI001F41169A|nr:division/cell wall cluster transcriptional repressor MraZ [Muricauda sp. SCSIO 65647]UJH68211.1 division/cell wall cluster transcriptional repressor MraZ [Muricauda sp. SCSIO 65647]
MINIIGTFNCKADAKGRVTIPSSLMSQLAPLLNDGFVIKHGRFSHCLELYPKSEYNRMMMQLKEKDQFDPDNVRTLRKFVEGAQLVNIDDSNRLQIPKALAEHALIKKEVKITSTINIIEIWDKESYDRANDINRDEFSSMLKTAFGKNDKSVSQSGTTQ